MVAAGVVTQSLALGVVALLIALVRYASHGLACLPTELVLQGSKRTVRRQGSEQTMTLDATTRLYRSLDALGERLELRTGDAWLEIVADSAGIDAVLPVLRGRNASAGEPREVPDALRATLTIPSRARVAAIRAGTPEKTPR